MGAENLGGIPSLDSEGAIVFLPGLTVPGLLDLVSSTLTTRSLRLSQTWSLHAAEKFIKSERLGCISGTAILMECALILHCNGRCDNLMVN